MISKSYSLTDERQVVVAAEVPLGETIYAVMATGQTETLRVLLPNLD